MIDPKSHQQLKKAIAECVNIDKEVLDQLRNEIGSLRSDIKRIQPRTTTSISLVGTDGGNNQLKFDPFLIQLIRVVDSSNNEYCLEVVSPTMPINILNTMQFHGDGTPKTALGEMMEFLGVRTLQELSHMIRPRQKGEPVPPSWVQVYRELVEWAVLFALLKKDFGTDTLIVCDGLLRTKVFAKDLFHKLIQEIKGRIDHQFSQSRRRIYLAGVAKHSKVLSRYRLAMSLEEILHTSYPAYVRIPREIEEKAYVWPEFARGDDRLEDSGEINKFVGGAMYFVKFGTHKQDPIWPIDIFTHQIGEAQSILGFMLADAINGFPVPYYPQCLQKAHENAALVDFDFDILQDGIYDGIRQSLGELGHKLDVFKLQDSDPSQKRYS
jgi:hypothetical protein